MSTIRLPDAPSNVTAAVLAGAAGPDIIPAGYRTVRRKKLTACYRHGRIDPHRILKFATEGNPGKCNNVENVVSDPGRPHLRESGGCVLGPDFS
jgi:hypothetical protein